MAGISAPSKKKPRRSVNVATLSLTSMMDMLTSILFFILMSYSTEGAVLSPDPRLKLPVSTASKKPSVVQLVQVTPDDIIVEGAKVADVKEALESKDVIIAPLYAELNRLAKKTEFIAASNPNVKFTGEVIIQGDKTIPFVLLEKIMFTCGQAGFNGISLAVTSID